MSAAAWPAAARRVALQPYPLALGALVAVGVGLRFWGLGAHYLTYDETFTALLARGSLADLLAAAAGDVHPPLYYLLVWAWVRLVGASGAVALRLPSALLGAAALPLLLAVARRLGLSRGATLVGLALFALSPFQVHFSQDARMYPLLQAAVLAALLGALSRRWWLLGLGLAVAVWAHNYGLFYWAVIGALAVVVELGRPVWVMGPAGRPVRDFNGRGLALALGAALAGWAPWAAVLLGQMGSLAGGYWIAPLSLGQFLYPLFSLAWGVTLPGRYAGLGALVACGGFLFAAVKAFRLRECRALVWVIVAPALLAAAVSLAWQPIYLFRAFVGVSGPLCLLLGWAVTARARGRLTAWALALVAPLLALSLANRGPALALATGENNRALEVVAAGWRPGDVIYHGNVGSLSGFLVAVPAAPNYLMPVQPGSLGVLTAQTRAALHFCEAPLEPGFIRADCGGRPVAQPWARVWLVWGASQTISGAEDEAIAALLAAYPSQKVLDIHDVYRGPMPVDGGIWLLSLPEEAQ